MERTDLYEGSIVLDSLAKFGGMMGARGVDSNQINQVVTRPERADNLAAFFRAGCQAGPVSLVKTATCTLGPDRERGISGSFVSTYQFARPMTLMQLAAVILRTTDGQTAKQLGTGLRSKRLVLSREEYLLFVEETERHEQRREPGSFASAIHAPFAFVGTAKGIRVISRHFSDDGRGWQEPHVYPLDHDTEWSPHFRVCLRNVGGWDSHTF